MTTRILFTDTPWGDCDIERAILEPAGIEVIEAPDGEEATLMSLAGDVKAIATCWAQVTQGVVQAAGECRHVARLGIGLDNIDIPAATDRGMIVTNVPDYCVEEVAQHALGLLLAHARQIAFFHRKTKQGTYDLQAAAPMHRLSGQTLGLIGFGRTAQKLREMALGLGLRLIAHNRSDRDYGTGCAMLSLEEVLQQSDYVSLHAPLTDDTEHLINAAALTLMRPTAFLINTSRGGLVDHAALWNAIKSGRLAGAGLDVFEPEPPDLSQPLFNDGRVIVTPHAAFVSVESLVELRERVAHQILDVIAGRIPEHVVNA